MPSGLRSPVVSTLSVHAATRLAPAESPANTIRLPMQIKQEEQILGQNGKMFLNKKN